jgi:Chlorophyllase enzyme
LPRTQCDGDRTFAAQFGQSEESTNKLLDLKGLDLKLYTVYRPANWRNGEKYPVVTWGNGTCAQPEGYATLLRYVASHGFIVVAANSQGSQGTMAVTSDARVKSVILFNVGQSASKPFFAISGDRDIAGALSTFKSALARATKGAYMWMHMVPGNGATLAMLGRYAGGERVRT